MLMENWYGMLGPAGTPADVQASLEKAMLEAVKIARASPSVWPRAARVARPTARDLREKLAKDVAFWGPELKKLGISGE